MFLCCNKDGMLANQSILQIKASSKHLDIKKKCWGKKNIIEAQIMSATPSFRADIQFLFYVFIFRNHHVVLLFLPSCVYVLPAVVCLLHFVPNIPMEQ